MIHRFAISDPSLFQVFSGGIKSNLVGNQLIALNHSDNPAAKLTHAALPQIRVPFTPIPRRDSETGSLGHRKRTLGNHCSRPQPDKLMRYWIPLPHRWMVCIILNLAFASATLTHAQERPPIAPVSRDALPAIKDAVEAHLGYVTDYCLDEYGQDETGIWLGQIDIRTSKLPGVESLRDSKTHSTIWPFGNLLLDQPTMVAAVEMGRRTGCKCYQDSITRYLRDQLQRMKAGTDDAFQVMLTSDYDLIRDKFVGSEKSWTTWRYLPAWEILNRESPEALRIHLENMLQNTNDILQRVDAPTEPDKSAKADTSADSGHTIGTLATERWMARSRTLSTLMWMANHFQSESDSSLARALPLTKLSEVDRQTFHQQPLGIQANWLNAVTSHPSLAPQLSEIQQQLPLLKVANPAGLTSEPSKEKSEAEAAGMIPNRFGFDDDCRYAEACLTAWKQTQQEAWLGQTKRKLVEIETRIIEQQSSFTRAETYGRAIHLLNRYSQVTNLDRYKKLADSLANQAMKDLYEPRLGMFRSRTGIDFCDSRDGIGFLLLALLALDGDDPTDASSLRF